MRLSVHLERTFAPNNLARLKALLDADVEITCGIEPPTPAIYQILVAGRPSRELLCASPQLSTLIIPWAGLPVETRDLLDEFPHLAVHNLHHSAAPVAEMALTLLLTAAKRVVPADRALREADWRPRYDREKSRLLAGKTALILGYGAVGRQIARFCRGLGMTVIATKRRATGDVDPYVEIHPPSALRTLLPRTDVLFVCLPHTPETDGLVGRDELEALPPDAILINIGRGPIVEEAAMYQALKEGKLFGAGLDVWYQYPTDVETRAHTPPSTWPFHELPNVVMSPHRASHTDESEKLRMVHLAELLNAAAEGRPMPNRVDLEAGY
jgi:phosphoglycerate dehydrogenase-like enzyme